MCIKPLGRHYSFENKPTIYDEDALTAMELCARTAGKVDECVKAINEHMVDCQDENTQHEENVAKQVNEAKQYMVDNLEENCGKLFDQAVEDGVFDTIPRDTYQAMNASLTAVKFGTFNVRDYGAVGDGETDDTNAIQNAINMAKQVSGSTVYIPAGIYKVSAPLIIYSHTRLLGGGKRGLSNTGYSGTHIVGATGTDRAVIKSDPTGTVFGAEIRDLRITADSNVNVQSSWGIYLDGVSECYLHNVTVNGGFAKGVYFKGTISHLDNLYVCANTWGLEMVDTHGVTVSNLNAWENSDQAVVITGNCCNTTIRDSWIENSQHGIHFSNDYPLLAYCVNIVNTSFTAGSNYEEARFIWAGADSTQYRIQGLNVSGCVGKISKTDYFLELNSSKNTIKANVENCKFFSNNEGKCAVRIIGRYANVTVKNTTYETYAGLALYVVDAEGGNYLELNATSAFTEVNSFYPLKLNEPEGGVQSFVEGQVYYKAGHLKLTDGVQANTIPVQGESVGHTTATTVEEMREAFNNLLDVLKDSGAIK